MERNGGLAANYSISTGQTTTANVTAKALTVSGITASNKVYDSTTTATTTLVFFRINWIRNNK